MRQLKRITPEETKHYVRLTRQEFDWHSKAVAYTMLPSSDPVRAAEGWEDLEYYMEGILDPSYSSRPPEWVYVLVNKGVPGICKIGMTTTSVPQRVREINSATGVITPWFAVYQYKCINSYALEQAVHGYLEDLGYRVNPNREGFELPSDVAIEVIEALGKKLTVVPKEFGGAEPQADTADLTTPLK
jgi:hypothetical protein